MALFETGARLLAWVLALGLFAILLLLSPLLLLWGIYVRFTGTSL